MAKHVSSGPKRLTSDSFKCKIEVALNFFFQVVGPGGCARQPKQVINGNWVAEPKGFLCTNQKRRQNSLYFQSSVLSHQKRMCLREASNLHEQKIQTDRFSDYTKDMLHATCLTPRKNFDSKSLLLGLLLNQESSPRLGA